MCGESLLNSCYLCQWWYQKPWDLSNVTHQWYLNLSESVGYLVDLLVEYGTKGVRAA